MTVSEQNKLYPVQCPVTDRQIVAPGYCRLALHAPAVVREARPGQFVMVYMPAEYPGMLPRPFSIYAVNRAGGELVLFFEIKGRGTELLAASRSGFTWKLLGPLGTGFPVPPPGSLLVAGGMGIAPLVFLAAVTDRPRILIYGAPTADRLICPSLDLALPGLTLIEVTEDGSRGEKGTASDVCRGLMAGAGAVFACGPKQMLASVASMGRRYGVKTRVSLEERMACGIGACLGCAVPGADGYRRVCRDGPVFPAEEVDLNG